MKFVTGRFRHIILLNYAVDPTLLASRLPPQTELDFHDGRTYLSLVGLQSSALKVYGLPLPLYQEHAQVNLRFYVRHRIEGTRWRHGVVFINQIIPHRFIAWSVRWLFHETVISRQIDAEIAKNSRGLNQVEYRWQPGQQHCYIRTAFHGGDGDMVPAADRDFFAERYWGYRALGDGGCFAYNFVHPEWKTYRGRVADTSAEVDDFYGPPFSGILNRPPDSAFVCSGSKISLAWGHRLQNGSTA
jgi:uncharacterized protein YqjF (DUF2071 family)